MRLYLFGRLRDLAEHLHGAAPPLGDANVADLIAWASAQSPELGAALKQPGVRFAVDQHFVDIGASVGRDSEVALMSPLSGG
jgi:molybdopterin converting factor small subunit